MRCSRANLPNSEEEKLLKVDQQAYLFHFVRKTHILKYTLKTYISHVLIVFAGNIVLD